MRGSPRLHVRQAREAIAARWLAGARAEDHYEDDCKNLWVAVLASAISDLTSVDRLVRTSALAWVQSRATEAASFEWICKLLDCDPDEVRERLTGGGAERLHRIATHVRASYGQIMRHGAA